MNSSEPTTISTKIWNQKKKQDPRNRQCTNYKPLFERQKDHYRLIESSSSVIEYVGVIFKNGLKKTDSFVKHFEDIEVVICLSDFEMVGIDLNVLGQDILTVSENLLGRYPKMTALRQNLISVVSFGI